MLQEMDPCPLDGWRREHVQVDELLLAICPFCGGKSEVPCG